MGIVEISKNLGVKHNVSFRVIDAKSGTVVQEHIGHNSATDSLLRGIGYYLAGNGVINQASAMLARYVPNYISLGTMGLYSQDEDMDGLPCGIGKSPMFTEEDNFQAYKDECPEYGSDGYDSSYINDRAYFGLGPKFVNVPIECELVSDAALRSPISFREVVSETNSELPQTIDVVFSAMISTGTLAQFRGTSDHIFISEAGLWSKRYWEPCGLPDSADVAPAENGLLAGYRIMPQDSKYWDMSVKRNRDMLKRCILRVGVNQVVQVVWKIQLGSVGDLSSVGCTHNWKVI